MTWQRDTDERGATAVMFVVLSTIIFAMGALAVDYSSLVMERQNLHDHIDSAAHAGAFELPDRPGDAVNAAVRIAKDQDPDISLETELFCVVASKGVSHAVNTAQIPSTCYPGPSPYTAGNYAGLRCNEQLCAIPCRAATGIRCNTIRVSDEKTVPFGFGRLININDGLTGSVASAACRGSCGTAAPNPMDVVIMADRTLSMSDVDRKAMATGIEGALKTMDPAMHYVALGALHKSLGTDPACLTRPVPKPRARRSGESSAAYNAYLHDQRQAGTWIPVPFSNDYLRPAAPPAPAALATTSRLARAVNCIRAEGSPGEYRTHLASALKGAARYLLGKDPNNLASLPSDRPGTLRRAIIFETDGKPQEVLSKDPTGLGLNTPGDMGVGGESDTQVAQACKNFTDIARETKAIEDTIIITIGFGAANEARCGNSGTHAFVRDALAAAASPHPGTGRPSHADGDCKVPADRIRENGDGDFYFCASDGADLGPIFQTALSSLSGSIKLLRLP